VQRDLPLKIASSGPFDAMIIRMGTHPYEPFDEDLLGALIPGCKVIASASAGFNEFDVDWMTKNNVYFTNTRNAVSEPTADMAIFLILAVLKDAIRADKSARAGQWRSDFVPTRDPTGLTLGIIGLGAIGKVSEHTLSCLLHTLRYKSRIIDTTKIASCSKSQCIQPEDSIL
jgi:lactate dehydrogenase-like 2-hydroxyacid dehydrogenase